jgi:Ca2+-binding RTX toxin-like protein
MLQNKSLSIAQPLAALALDINGDINNNYLVGTLDNDRIFGLGGDDSLLDREQPLDPLAEYGGDDQLRGGDGNDNLYSYGGLDTLYGDDGDDYLVSNDVVGTGVLFFGGNGNDSIYGSIGFDTLYGESGDDNLNGGGGNDILSSGIGNDSLDGGEGDDALSSNGSDYLVGDSGNDTLFSSATGNSIVDRDTLLGGSGDDLYIIKQSTNIVTELLNEGIDRVDAYTSYSLGANIENLSLLDPLATNISGAFSATGNSLNNVLTGNSTGNVMSGKAGNDRLVGQNGNDVYVIDADLDLGVDTIVEISTGGIDAIDFRTTTTKEIKINLASTLGQTVATGVGFASALTNIEYIYGGSLNDNIVGNSLNNYFLGGTGNDTLTGGLGTDYLIGGLGNDSLMGGADNDILQGSAGNDILKGEAGSDRFWFNGVALTGINTVTTVLGRDTISDFVVGTDKLVLSKVTFGAISSAVGTPIGSNFISVATDAIALTGTQSAAIVYSRASGNLFYNPNGTALGLGTNGGNFAVLASSLNLTASDFVVTFA